MGIFVIGHCRITTLAVTVLHSMIQKDLSTNDVNSIGNKRNVKVYLRISKIIITALM